MTIGSRSLTVGLLVEFELLDYFAYRGLELPDDKLHLVLSSRYEAGGVLRSLLLLSVNLLARASVALALRKALWAAGNCHTVRIRPRIVLNLTSYMPA